MAAITQYDDLEDRGGNPEPAPTFKPPLDPAHPTQATAGTRDAQGYVNPVSWNGEVPVFTGRNQASNAMAWLTRQQWDDYRARFAPMEDSLIGMTTYGRPDVANREIEKGRQAASGGYEQSFKTGISALTRYGAAISEDEVGMARRTYNHGRTAAVVDAANRIRQRLIDQNRAVALGAGNAALASAGGGGGA